MATTKISQKIKTMPPKKVRKRVDRPFLEVSLQKIKKHCNESKGYPTGQ